MKAGVRLSSTAALACTLWAQAGSYPASRHGGPYMFNYYIPPAPATTPWAPAWSPDGKWIAAGMQGAVWKIDVRTGEAFQLTAGRAYHSSPDWSPDGKWIVYTADYDGARVQLEILDVTTGESRALTDDGAIYLDPVFSPDGSQVAYVSTLPHGYFNIYIRPVRDGQWQGDPVAVTADNRYPRDRLYFGPWDMHIQPAWTPDGKELLFVSNRNVPLGSGDVWRAPARAGGIREATPVLREQTLYRTRPHISPDGKRILYASTVGPADQFNNLYVIPISGGSPYKLTFGAYDHFHPRWSPDGEWIAYVSNEDGLSQLCLLESFGGGERKVEVRKRHWKQPMGRLHLKVVDGVTGRTISARIHGLAADGKFYAPPESSARIGNRGLHNFHMAGETTYEVPPGRMTIGAVKGFEYTPVEREIEIHPDRITEVQLALERIADLPAKGWYSGSTHAHMNYGGNHFNTPERLAAMASAEDLHMVNALVANKDNRILDWQYFRPGGHDYPLRNSDPGVRVNFGEEYRPAFYGHTFLLGLREHLISPYTSGYEGTAIDSLYPTVTDMFRKAKSQGAITSYVHPFGDADPLESGLGAKSFPVDAALGTLDCLEWSDAVRGEMPVWHKMLNNDIRLTPVGGEDSINDLHRLRQLGAIRTYVYVEGPFSGPSWHNGLRKGHTFFTTGPLLEFRINGKLPGDDLRLPPGGGTVTIEAAVVGAAPLSRVVIYDRHGVYREIPLDEARKSARLRTAVKVTESDWFSLTAEGPAFKVFDGSRQLAATNAIRVYAGDQKIRDRASAEYFIRWMDKLRDMTEEWRWWRSEAEKRHVLEQYEQARKVYEGFRDY